MAIDNFSRQGSSADFKKIMEEVKKELNKDETAEVLSNNVHTGVGKSLQTMADETKKILLDVRSTAGDVKSLESEERRKDLWREIREDVLKFESECGNGNFAKEKMGAIIRAVRKELTKQPSSEDTPRDFQRIVEAARKKIEEEVQGVKERRAKARKRYGRAATETKKELGIKK